LENINTQRAFDYWVIDQLSVLRVFEVRETISPLALAKLQKEKRQRTRNKSGKDENKGTTDW
jgi:hypothetical protein